MRLHIDALLELPFKIRNIRAKFTKPLNKKRKTTNGNNRKDSEIADDRFDYNRRSVHKQVSRCVSDSETGPTITYQTKNSALRNAAVRNANAKRIIY